MSHSKHVSVVSHPPAPHQQTQRRRTRKSLIPPPPPHISQTVVDRWVGEWWKDEDGQVLKCLMSSATAGR